jgi:hypothetical protein
MRTLKMPKHVKYNKDPMYLILRQKYWEEFSLFLPIPSKMRSGPLSPAQLNQTTLPRNVSRLLLKFISSFHMLLNPWCLFSLPFGTQRELRTTPEG